MPRRRAHTSWWSRPTLFDKGYLWFVVVAVLGPFIPLLIWSVTFNWFWPSLLPTRWWWEGRQVVRQLLAWDYIFSPVSQVGPAIVNTLVIGIIVTLLSILVGVPAARVLARREFRGKQIIEFFLLTPLIVPGIAISLGLVVIFIRIRLIDTMTGVVLSHLVGTVPYMVRILTSVFAGLSPEYEEQARALGASPLKSFVFVTMPMVIPGIIAGSLFAFLISVNTFLQTFFIGGGRIVTLPTVLFNFIGQGGGSNIPVAAGVTLILSLPGFLFLLLTERYIKEEQFAQGFGG